MDADQEKKVKDVIKGESTETSWYRIYRAVCGTSQTLTLETSCEAPRDSKAADERQLPTTTAPLVTQQDSPGASSRHDEQKPIASQTAQEASPPSNPLQCESITSGPAVTTTTLSPAFLQTIAIQAEPLFRAQEDASGETTNDDAGFLSQGAAPPLDMYLQNEFDMCEDMYIPPSEEQLHDLSLFDLSGTGNDLDWERCLIEATLN